MQASTTNAASAPGGRAVPARPDWEAELPAECRQLRAAGIRVTRARVQVLHALNRGVPRHRCAEALFRSMLQAGSDIRLCTLYRVLTEFVRAGLASSLSTGTGGVLYERNDRPGHHHLTCMRCGSVVEVFDSALGKAQARIARAHGFAMSGTGAAMHGLCAACAV
ncbi:MULTISPECIES: Fur family transcriptional regulator [Cupriavidus]